jgi:high affinity sulfate transporter 1
LKELFIGRSQSDARKSRTLRLRRFVPGLETLLHYDRAWLSADVIAGVSVAAVAVPIAIAYSQLAGVPPAHGLYASIRPLLAYAAFGTSRQLIMAPDAATCAIVAATVLPLAGADAARYVSLTAALAIAAGIVCIAAGLARLGFLTNFLARPILTGYLNGIAVSIIVGQLGHLFGFQLKSGGFFVVIADFLSKLGQTHWPTLAIGVVIFILLRVLKRAGPRVPAPLIAVGLGILLAALLDLDQRGVGLLGAIPAGLPPLSIPDVQRSDMMPLALGALGLALISYNSAMVTARGFALKNRYDIDSNQEFIALGVADIGAGLLQGFAISGADSRTAVNDSVGGKTQLTGVVAAALLVAVLLFFTGPLALLPVTVLAAVLINSALGLFDVPNLLWLRRVSPQEFRLSIVTLLGVITVGVLPGVVVAVGLALVQLLARASHPHDAELGRLPGIDGYRNISGHPDAVTIPGVILYRFDASVLFFNADYFKARVRAVVDAAQPKPRWLVIDAGTIAYIDVTGAAMLREVFDDLSRAGVEVAMAEVKGPVRAMLERTGLSQQIGFARIFPTVEAAVADITTQATVRSDIVHG